MCFGSSGTSKKPTEASDWTNHSLRKPTAFGENRLLRSDLERGSSGRNTAQSAGEGDKTIGTHPIYQTSLLSDVEAQILYKEGLAVSARRANLSGFPTGSGKKSKKYGRKSGEGESRESPKWTSEGSKLSKLENWPNLHNLSAGKFGKSGKGGKSGSHSGWQRGEKVKKGASKGKGKSKGVSGSKGAFGKSVGNTGKTSGSGPPGSFTKFGFGSAADLGKSTGGVTALRSDSKDKDSKRNPRLVLAKTKTKSRSKTSETNPAEESPEAEHRRSMKNLNLKEKLHLHHRSA